MPRCKWEENIGKDTKEIGVKTINRIEEQDKYYYKSLVQMTFELAGFINHVVTTPKVSGNICTPRYIQFSLNCILICINICN